MDTQINVGDTVSVRPMGNFNSVWGTVVSHDEQKGKITVKKDNGEETTIVYGRIFNYGKK